MTTSATTIYHVGAARDAHGVNLRHAAVVIHRGKIVQVTPPQQVNEHDYPEAQHIHLPDVLVLPRMVNAHAHLDLTTLGPLPYPGDFTTWLKQIITNSPGKDQVHDAVTLGWRASRDAGVALIADIARHIESCQALAATGAGYLATSFLERFGQGQWEQEAIEQLRDCAAALQSLHEDTGLHVGLQPHAPYSAGLNLYLTVADVAHRSPLRLSTHLAESMEEDQFIRSASGLFVDMLKSLNKWDGSIQAHHQSPVARLAPALEQAHWLVAHCNYVSDDDIALLAQHAVSVAYCPTASAYFGHENHRYRDMLSAGINVCLGTDSIVCQKPDEPQPLGIWPQMRFLFERDRCPVGFLLEMATINGARALDADAALVTLQPDSPGDILAVRFDPQLSTDPLEQALRLGQPIERLTSLTK